MPATKQAIRKAMLGQRDAMDANVRLKRSRLAQEHLLLDRTWRAAVAVGLYMAIGSEAGTDLLLKAALGQGKQVWLPRLTGPGQMRLNRACDAGGLKPGKWGILEPPPGPEPARLDLVILPGLAFDRAGNRLGYGAGYYDRYLQSHANLKPVCIGLCLAFQIVDQLPADSWDAPVSALCSEEGLLWL
ncbi:MAG: 5-formyltetrahydrofolate cyclo-ligase [Desulfovibrio sp.]|nr:5-formyltetrahydrofolate cyclo-ligase [Desulfovibrio sp.]